MKKTHSPTISEIALSYAAGLFDGEGSVMIILCRKPRSEYQFHKLVVSLSSTDSKVIDWMIDNFGGKAYSHPGKGNHKDAWKWMLSSMQAENFLRSIKPYLIIKELQANVAFKLRETMGVSSYSPVTPYLFAEREDLRSQMRELNRRGVR